MGRRDYWVTHVLICAGLLAGLLGVSGATMMPDPRRAATPIGPTPTVDRLAAPPTAEHPTQADEGAQLYWLHCQPCHGDRAQGLTDEWRDQYPPEDRNCWESGCHGKRPYEQGFVLPKTVPALVGKDSLRRFETVGQVYQFMRAAMPFQAPGSLSDDEYLAITSFLAREHNVAPDLPADAETINRLPLRPAEATAAATVATPTPLPPRDSNMDRAVTWQRLTLPAILFTALLVAVVWIARRRGEASRGQ